MNSILRKGTAALAAASIVISMVAPLASVNAAMDSAAAEKLASLGVIVSQANPADYRLGDSITRREMLKVMMKLSNITVEDKCEGKFADLPATDWGCKYAEAALANGMIAANTNFRPDDQVSKIEALKMIFKGLGLEREENADWKAGYVNTAVAKGLVSNFSDYDAVATRGFIFSGAANGVEVEEETMVEDDLDLGGLFGDLDTEDETMTEETTTEETTTEETTTEETTTDNTAMVEGNVLEVTVSPETPAAGELADGINADVLKFDVTAGDEDVTITSLVLKRNGLGASSAIESVVVFDGTERVSKTKKFNSTTDLAEVNLSTDVVVKAGETKTLTARVNTITNASNLTFSVSVETINASSSVQMSSVESERFTIVNIATTSLTFALDGSITTPKLGEEQVDLLKFKATNGGEGNEDTSITSITFKENGSIREEEDLANLTLFFNGEEVASVASMGDKYVTFDFATPILIKEDKTEKFVLKGDVNGGAGDSIEFFIDNTLDITATASKNGNASIVNNVTDANVSAVTVQAGQVTIVDIDADDTDVLDNKDNVVFGTMKVVANSGKDLYVDSVAYTLTDNNHTLDTALENIELYDATNGVSFDPNEATYAAASKKFTFTDLDINIANGTELVLEIRADIKNNANVNDKIIATVDVANDVIVKESADDKTVTDIVPSSISFKGLTIVKADMSINALVASNTNVVIGTKGVDSFDFEVRSNNDASDLTVRELTVKGAITDASSNNAAGVLSNSRVNALYLYEGDVLLSQKSASELNSNGEVTFDGFNVNIPKNTAKVFNVRIDVLDDTNNNNDTITLSLVGYDVEDSESDNVYITNDLDGVLDGNTTTSTDSNTQDTAKVSDRVVTIKGVGTLTAAVDNTDTETNHAKNILGGITSEFIASYELTAVNEGIEIKDLVISEETNGVELKNAVSEIIIYANDKTTELGRQIVTSDTINFNNIDFVVEEGASNIYLKAVTHKMGKDEAGSQTANLTLALDITDAEGEASAKDVTVPAKTSASNAFDVIATKVSAVSFVNEYNGVSVASTLSAGDNNVAIIAITTDSSVNTDSADGGELKTILEQVKFTVDFAEVTINTGDDFSIERIGGASDTAIAIDSDVQTGHEVAITTNFATDDEIDNGSTAYYLVKALDLALTGTGDHDSYIKISFPTLNDSEIKYTNDGSSNNTSITDLRLGITTLDGTKIND